ncbi:hypothetical protein SE27_01955 [Acinetobacter harbinensis]|nr:hypothetical protein SE27_01955 [Acinetobacter harbinensis]
MGRYLKANQKIKKVLTSNTSKDTLILIHLCFRCIFFAVHTGIKSVTARYHAEVTDYIAADWQSVIRSFAETFSVV